MQIAIQASSRLYLTARTKGENEMYFVDRFRDTWRRIPLGVRRSLRAYWRPCCYFGRHSPSIKLVRNLKCEHSATGESVGVYGLMENSGHGLRFSLPHIREMPAHCACDLIAHELAHCFQRATGTAEAIAYFSMGDANARYAISEFDADRTTEEWGFNPRSIGFWRFGMCLVERFTSS